MPYTAESTEYDLFDHKLFDEPALTLDEAVNKAMQLRSSDPQHFYRIQPLDTDRSSFRIEKVSRERVYADLVSRWSALLNRFIYRASK